jgi:hypothetical protein
MKKIKTYLFENYRLASDQIKDWVSSFDEKYLEINTEVRRYERSDDLHFFGLLINPNLERICTSSSFQTIMGSEAEQSFGKEYDADKHFMQIEYFTYLMYEAISWREKNKIQPLILEINYYGDFFLGDINNGDLGEDTKSYMKLLFRHYEGHIIMNIYDEFNLKKTVKTEEDLNFTK